MATSKTKEFKSTKRFGARYGGTVRHRIALVEKEQKAVYKCPVCNYKAVKRMAAGIWLCNKCGAKIAGGAYSLGEKPVIRISEEGVKAPAKEA